MSGLDKGALDRHLTAVPPEYEREARDIETACPLVVEDEDGAWIDCDGLQECDFCGDRFCTIHDPDDSYEECVNSGLVHSECHRHDCASRECWWEDTYDPGDRDDL